MEFEDVSILLMRNLSKVKNWNKNATTEPTKEKYNKILVSSEGTLNKVRIKDIEMNAMKLEITFFALFDLVPIEDWELVGEEIRSCWIRRC